MSIKKNGPYYYVSIVVAQVGDDPPMLGRLHAKFGGSVHKRESRKRNAEPCWYWQVVGLDAQRMLEKVHPFLILKREQTLLAMRFREYAGRAGENRSSAQKAGQKALYEEIARAKKEGPDIDASRTLLSSVSETAFNAWVAGLVDGDGCIGIQVSQGRYYSERVAVGQPEEGKGLLEALAEIFGGTVHRRRCKNRPPFYQWDINGPRASAMLQRLQPHLVQKRPQADLVLQFRETVERTSKRRSPDVKARQRSLYEKARALNRYGTRASSFV